MRPIKPPPPVLDSAQVIAYAIVDHTVRWTGRQKIFVGDQQLGAVPCLAICKNLFGDLKDFLIFHCDNRWNVLGVSGAPTLRKSMEQTELWYEGVSGRWVRTGVTKKMAKRWLRTQFACHACAMCGKLPQETDGRFMKKSVSICFPCVRNMHQSIVDRER